VLGVFRSITTEAREKLELELKTAIVWGYPAIKLFLQSAKKLREVMKWSDDMSTADGE
jgi:hypothetical protein